MRVDVQKKVRIIKKSMETIRKSDKTLHTISFPRLAQELNYFQSKLSAGTAEKASEWIMYRKDPDGFG